MLWTSHAAPIKIIRYTTIPLIPFTRVSFK
jgi:hypothetical protein